MDIVFVGEVLSILGEVIIALVVFDVHRHVLKEKRIDADVLRTIRQERVYAAIGIILLVVGFVLRMLG